MLGLFLRVTFIGQGSFSSTRQMVLKACSGLRFDLIFDSKTWQSTEIPFASSSLALNWKLRYSVKSKPS